MRRLVWTALLAATCVVAASAQAKGPISGTIEGPGAGGGISLGGNAEPGSGAALGSFAQHAGFFETTFGPGPTAERPRGDLGPRYTVTYVVPGPNGREDRIHQDLYPYAPSGPVTYTKPGQSFFDTRKTAGGWHQASQGFKNMLVNAGLPPSAPAATDDGGGSTGLVDIWPALVAAFGLGLVAVTAVFLRRRPRTAAT